MKSVPQQVSESVRRRNPHLYQTISRTVSDGDTSLVAENCNACLASQQPPKPPKRIRQSTKPLLNKLELSFYSYLCAFYPSVGFHAQSIRFKLGNGIWYKPDVVCFNWGDNNRTCCWEIKGPHAFRGGFENLKVAAHAYPKIEWRLVWQQGNKWEQQLVLP